MDARPSAQQRLRYAFDNTMARGTPALAEDATSEFGVRINPPKSAAISLGMGDRVIVLAED